MKLIPLNKTKPSKHLNAPKFAQVDDEDYEMIMQSNWHAVLDGNTFYAAKCCKNKSGNKSSIRMHQVIMEKANINKNLIDHKDLNGVNNQKDNLRIASHAENSRNTTPRKGSSSVFLGVSKCSTKTKNGVIRYYWVAKSYKGSISTFLGCFPYTPEGEIAAAKCYDAYALLHYGEFANLNFKK